MGTGVGGLLVLTLGGGSTAGGLVSLGGAGLVLTGVGTGGVPTLEGLLVCGEWETGVGGSDAATGGVGGVGVEGLGLPWLFSLWTCG